MTEPSIEKPPASEVMPVPAEEALNFANLEPWLREHLGATGPIEAARFTVGHANLTYLLRIGNAEYVLRRPPLGPIPPGAHDMAREHRVLSVLHAAYPLAPRSLLLCTDESVIGAPFMIVERRRGQVITTDVPESYLHQPGLTRRIGDMVIDALADLHQVDPASVGLDTLGRPDGMVARQLEGWTRRWHAALDRPYPEMDPLLTWLQANMPKTRNTVLLHNDFKLDNMIVASDDPARPVAVLDWDMATQGDPLLDLGYLLNWWAEPEDDPAWIEAGVMPTWRPGFPTREEAIARYAARTGFDVSDINWYYVYNAFRLAVIIQQIYIRYVRGQTTNPSFANFGDRVATLVSKALVLARG